MAAAAEAVALLEALRGQVAAVTAHGRGLLQRLRGGRLRTEKGLSLLEVRAQALLSYLQDLGLLLAGKAAGRSLRELPALPRLLETRLVLEKLRPLELRLNYHVQKLLRAGGRGDDDPLRFRPSPANMAAPEEEEEEEEEEGEGGAAGGGGAKAPGRGGGRRYVPPRLVPVPYEGAEPAGAWQRAWQRARRRALSSSVIRELREELGDAPLEEGGAGATPRHARQRAWLEESFLQRLRGRGAGGAGPGAGPGDALRTITSFGDITPLLDSAPQEAPPPKKRRRAAQRGRGGRRRR